MKNRATQTLMVVVVFFAFVSQVAAQATGPGMGQTGQPPVPRTIPLSETSPMSVPRASEIIGLTVANAQNENLGKVNDLILDNDGQVSYLIIGRGGLMGMGEKLCAIPWQAANAEVREKAVIVSMSKQQLEGAPVFENWNEFSSGDFKSKVQAYYGAEAQTEGQTTTKQ